MRALDPDRGKPGGRFASGGAAVGDAGPPLCEPSGRVRVCLVYDCLFPHTVGGAERWYRNLGERLAADGHEVTYLTLRQWDRGDRPRRGGRRRARRRPADGAVRERRERPAADPAAARVRARRAVAPAAARPPLRRRAHRLVPLLLAAGGGGREAAAAATRSSSTGTRCGRAPTGASTSAAPAAPSARSCSGCARACRSAPSASRGCTRRGCAARACAASRRC